MIRSKAHLCSLLAIMAASLFSAPVRATQVCDGTGVSYRDRAAALYARGNLSGAVLEIQEGIARCPDEPFYYFMLGNAWYRAGKLADAARAYEAFLKARPDHFEGQISLGFTLRKLKDARGARDHWTDALHLQPSSPLAHAALAVALFELNDAQDAVVHYDRAVSLDGRYGCPKDLAVDIRWDSETLNALGRVSHLSQSYQSVQCPAEGSNPRG